MNINEIASLRKDIKVAAVFAGLTLGFITSGLMMAMFADFSFKSTWGNLLILLTVFMAAGALISAFVCVLDSNSLLRNYQNSSGLHSWRELPKGKVLSWVKRIDEVRTAGTVLSIINSIGTIDTRSVLQYFYFDRSVPSGITNKIIILDSPDELLHRDFEAGVTVLLTHELESPDRTFGARQVPEQAGATSIPKPA